MSANPDQAHTNGATPRGTRREPVTKPRPRRAAPMTAAESVSSAGFPEHFRESALPHLTLKCRVCGLLIALQLMRFEDAHSDIMRAAMQRGAGHLPEPIFAELDHWCCIKLMTEAERHEREIDSARQLADRVARQCRTQRELGCG